MEEKTGPPSFLPPSDEIASERRVDKEALVSDLVPCFLPTTRIQGAFTCVPT